MKLRPAFLFLILCGLGACATDADNVTETVHTQCRLELDAARTAVHLRDRGKSKQDMLHSLPPLHTDSTRLLHQLYAIVDETYTFPKLNDVVFGIYHYDNCTRQLRVQAMPALESIYPKLLACQARFGRQVDKQAVSCVRRSYHLPASTPDTTPVLTPGE